MRILLVEDHPQLAESVAQALRGAGWTVDLLHDGIAADTALASEDYALAILDVGLPRLDGFQVLARLRGRGKTLPVLMLTARGEVSDRVHGLNLGADDYRQAVRAVRAGSAGQGAAATQRRRRRAPAALRCTGLRPDARRFSLADEPLTLTSGNRACSRH